MTMHADVVAEARTLLGSPYHHQGRKPGVGIDCAGVLIVPARRLSLVPAEFDVKGYSPEPDGVSLLAWCDRFMERVPQAQMRAGNAVVIAVDQHPQHLGIVADWRHGAGLSIIHAESIRQQRVIETRLVFGRSMRFVMAYRLPGLED